MEQIKLTVILCGESEKIAEENSISLRPDREVSVGSYGVSMTDMYQQMMYVQRYFGKEEYQKIIQLIIEYGCCVNDDKTASVYSESCAEYFTKNHQICYCTHQDIASGRYHTHMLINPISYTNGEIFDTNIENMNRFCEYISKLSGISCELFFEKK